MKYYLNQNSKLKQENIFKFSLPVVKTCPQAKECLKFCYGLKGHYVTFKKTVDQAHKNNLAFTQSVLFCQDLITEIHKRKIKTIRLHDTGDFYSQAYLDRISRVASFCNDTFFYAYTKSLHLNFDDFLSLPNTKIIQSYGGKLDKIIDQRKSHSVVFKSKKELTQAKYVDCTESDKLAIKSKRVGLVFH